MNKRIIHMSPDYGGALFWDEDGTCTGGVDYLILSDDENDELDLSSIKGLADWYYNWDAESLWHKEKWNHEDWKRWWDEGLVYAKQIKTLLPPDISLAYFGVTNRIWKVKPEDTNDGGFFDYTDPIEL